MLCHEGPWHFVWLIHTDGSGLTSVHPRTMDMEIAGHEFFSQDGKKAFFTTCKRRAAWSSGRPVMTSPAECELGTTSNARTGRCITTSRRTAIYSPATAAARPARTPAAGRLIRLATACELACFVPKTGLVGLPDAAAKQVKTGSFNAERLVDLSKHNYSLEPNVTFATNGKWRVFRSNMHGPTQVYAVEVAKTE